MPCRSTLYWDGTGEIPLVIDTLPPQQRSQALKIVQKKVIELKREEETNPLYIIAGMILVVIVFAFFAVKSKKSSV
jgi:LPXTG-motif cell wall-anchored protein